MPVEGDTEAMSEIEKAIMYWEEFKQEAIDMIAEGKYSNSVLEKQIPMCNTALAALREQAERSRGCVWCNENNKVYHDGQHFHFFCSYCGKRLEVEP